MGWTQGWRKCLAQGVVSNSADVPVPTRHQWTPLYWFTSVFADAGLLLHQTQRLLPVFAPCFGLWDVLVWQKNVHAFIFSTLSVSTSGGCVRTNSSRLMRILMGKKRERNHHLQIIHWAFFHSFYSACTFVCVAWRACCPGPELHSLPLFLPPVSLFVYVRLESCIHEDASVILTEQHTQSRQEAWHHQFPCSSVCKISTLSFPNLEERNTYVSIKFG